MSPNDAGRVTDTATPSAQMANSLANLASPPLDEDDIPRLVEDPPRKADIRLFNDPSNYLG